MRFRYALLAGAVVAFDQFTKYLVVSSLVVGESVEVIDGLLWFTHVRNSGAAFGLLRGWSGVLALVALIGVLAFAAVIVRRPPTWVGVGAGLVAGGALGNLLDRVFRPWPLQGTVVDFVDLRWWPSFNVADSAITVGAVILIVSGFRDEQTGDQQPVPTTADREGDGTADDRDR